MSYYWFNKQELVQKLKEKHENGGKEKSAKHYRDNKNVLKEKARYRYKNLSEEEKEAETERSKNRYKEMKKNANLFLQYKNE